VLATDFSEQMIEYMNNVIKKESYENIEAKVMDGQNMYGVQDNTFDYAYSIFGLIYFPDRLKGFKEIHRVLKPNGKVAVTAWRPEVSFIRIFTYAFNQFFNTNANNNTHELPLKSTCLSLSDESKFKSEMEKSGFRDVKIHSVTHYMSFPNQQAFLQHWQGNPVYEDIIKFIPSNRKHEFDNHMLSYLSIHYPDITKLACPCYIGVGTK